MTAKVPNGVGVVETHTLTLSLPEGGFHLEEGGVLPRVDVAWEGCGLVRPGNDNVVFIEKNASRITYSSLALYIFYLIFLNSNQIKVNNSSYLAFT